jgi:BirA family biotin operon repressor/biotin-[acetyl-CoA-carboxylase] ligase
MSLLLGEKQLPTASQGASPLIALASGVALVETLQPLVARQSVGIHWPNDVMVADRKIGGILVEGLGFPSIGGASSSAPERAVVIGIGVNTNSSLSDAPHQLRPIATTLRDITGRSHDQTELLVALLGRLEEALGRLQRSPQRIARQADALCRQRGRRLTLQQGGRQITGRCAGIAEDGGLLLDTETGQHAYYSGVLIPQEAAE